MLTASEVSEMASEYGIETDEVRVVESTIREGLAAGAAYVVQMVEAEADRTLYISEDALRLLDAARGALKDLEGQ